jgi:hypothetical protein
MRINDVAVRTGENLCNSRLYSPAASPASDLIAIPLREREADSARFENQTPRSFGVPEAFRDPGKWQARLDFPPGCGQIDFHVRRNVPADRET